LSDVASSTLEDPFGATATLRVARVHDLVRPRELRVKGVGEMLCDYALKVGIDHGSE
jgi:hypothetical protein